MARQENLGDFPVQWHVLRIAALAIPIGALAALSALVLLRLIAFFTNVFYFGRFSTAANLPANSHLGWFAVLAPVGGALIVGLMARYGSPKIRGHGIPEALEAILLQAAALNLRSPF